MKLHNVKLSTEEVFEVVEILKTKVENNPDKDLLSAFNKLSSVKVPEFKNLNYDYDIPEFKPRKEK